MFKFSKFSAWLSAHYPAVVALAAVQLAVVGSVVYA